VIFLPISFANDDIPIVTSSPLTYDHILPVVVIKKEAMNVMSSDFELIRIGRDRMTEVLKPYLGPNLALERANNIAQALVFGCEDPTHVALEMLNRTGINNTSAVAAEVGRAWMTRRG